MTQGRLDNLYYIMNILIIRKICRKIPITQVINKFFKFLWKSEIKTGKKVRSEELSFKNNFTSLKSRGLTWPEFSAILGGAAEQLMVSWFVRILLSWVLLVFRANPGDHRLLSRFTELLTFKLSLTLHLLIIIGT